MTKKKYFIKPIGREPKEVTHEEYVRMAQQQLFGTDIERILENATRKTLVCGTTHMFWTETTK